MLRWSSCVRNCATPWTVAHQALLSMGFSRQEHWSGCHFLLQGIFLTQGSTLSPAWAGGFSTTEPPETLTLRFTDHKIDGKEKTCLLTMKTSLCLSLFEHISAVLLGEKPSLCLSICSGHASCRASQLDQMYGTLCSVLVAKWVFLLFMQWVQWRHCTCCPRV